MMRNEKGFTLMELMIVIVIIGVLAAIGVPAYNANVKKARTAACQANQRTISTAVGMYYAENGEYPVVTDTTVDTDEIVIALKGYIDNISEIKCPEGGGYAVDASGHVTCTKNADHNK